MRGCERSQVRQSGAGSNRVSNQAKKKPGLARLFPSRSALNPPSGRHGSTGAAGSVVSGVSVSGVSAGSVRGSRLEHLGHLGDLAVKNSVAQSMTSWSTGLFAIYSSAAWSDASSVRPPRPRRPQPELRRLSSLRSVDRALLFLISPGRASSLACSSGVSSATRSTPRVRHSARPTWSARRRAQPPPLQPGLGDLGFRRRRHESLNSCELHALGVDVCVDVPLQRIQSAELRIEVLFLGYRGDLLRSATTFAVGLCTRLSRWTFAFVSPSVVRAQLLTLPHRSCRRCRLAAPVAVPPPFPPPLPFPPPFPPSWRRPCRYRNRHFRNRAEARLPLLRTGLR